MTTYYYWDNDPSNITIALDLSDRDFPIADDGHIRDGNGKLIASLPFRLGCSLG